ncbi:MAG TPA: hypothetical protein VFH61_17610, partial [Thermoleophilia bacterium]|nr:hypothetical protein [Thermoleophilia bacterium]
VWETTGEDALLHAIERGTQAYAAKLFVEGMPKFGDQRVYPTDVHCASSAIDYFARASRLDGHWGDQARGVAAWAFANLYQPTGRFTYQQTRWYRNRIPYIRWSEAHMMRALARLVVTSPS